MGKKKAKKWTRTEVAHEALRLTGEKNCIAAEALLASLVVGPWVKPIERFMRWTHWSADQLRKVAKNLRASGVWRKGQVHAEWADKKNGGMAFLCDVAVGQGMLRRTA